MRYWDLTIWSIDQDYLDRLSDLYDIDYYEADIVIDDKTNNASITNQLFYYVLYQAVERLDISQRSKEHLQESIYCNCLDSWFDIDSTSVDDEFTWAKKNEKKLIKEFLDL